MSEGIRVVVAGSRFSKDKEFVWASLDLIHAERNIVRLAHGDCDGADKLARDWAISRGIDVRGYPVDWRQFPFGDPRQRALGPQRNALMLKTEHPDLVITFPGGKGTRNLLKQAEQLGLNILEVAQWNKTSR
jgi:hypothetical protein